MGKEKVLCFETSLFQRLGVFQGMSLEIEKYMAALTNRSNVQYLDRAQAEHNRRYKQIIPYALILCGDKILRYRRGKRGAESRLHGLYSVGVGGHILEQEIWPFSRGLGYREAMRRRLMEELDIDVTNEKAVAVINDDSTDVGCVHFGVVHVVRVADESLAHWRCGVVHPEFIPVNEAVNDAFSYESWSHFCLMNLDGLLSKAETIAPARYVPAKSNPDETSAMVLQILERKAAFGF
ncbi:MAG TPA: phosphoesterase [Verrucomicrobiae bacterium]|jgi:predicted NUDIX family phosphoesterase|nr:phosphoesterase [Verrucomicrobiae bacterium]